MDTKRWFSLGFMSSLKDKNIRFNPRPFSKPKQPTIKKINKTDNFVDLHLEIREKVDQLIAEMEKPEQEQ
jgi:hypothetical protein